jgi:hypothetical protein
MDDKRKRYLVAGIVVGAVSVGLVVLARRTPREQWGPTLLRIARDGLQFARGRYSADLIAASERILDRLEAAVGEGSAEVPAASPELT